MCGILGGFNTDLNNLNIIESALEQIKHRGPDDVGFEIFKPHFLGMRRLSIIDTHDGHQPLTNEQKDVWVVLNGEIYNYKSLRKELLSKGHKFLTKTDTEVLVHLYEEEGERMVSRLRGMFAFCVLDLSKQKMFLGRDRFGKKPLYIANVKEKFWFASELKSLITLMQSDGTNVNIRKQAVYDYLTLGFIPQPQTVFSGIRCVPPACSLTISFDNIYEDCYWKLSNTQHNYTDLREVKEQIRDKIKEAVSIRLQSDVPLGVLLSGGLDSSIVAYEAAKEVGSELHTFTVGTDDPLLDESTIAADTARNLGVKNIKLTLDVAPVECLQYLVKHYDQPFADSSAIPSYAICKRAKEYVTVLLNGDGGDEIFGGYRRYLAAGAVEFSKFIPKSIFSFLANILSAVPSSRRGHYGFLMRFIRGMALDPSSRYLTWTLDMLNQKVKSSVWKQEVMNPTENLINNIINENDSFLRQVLSTDRQLILLSDLLVKMDMASMAASVEARSPLLDHELAELADTLPDNYLVSGRTTKYILREAYVGRLSTEVISGRKRGFEIPMAIWLKNDFYELINDTVISQSSEVAEYLDPKFIRSIYNGALPELNTAYIRYSLLVLELWLRSWKKLKN